MRPFDDPQPFDGGGGGGPSAAVDVLYLTPVAPSTSINVGDELNYRALHTGGWQILATAADYETHFPAVGGVHTIDAPAIQTATIQLPVGNRVHIAATGSLSGRFGVQTALVGSVAGPLVSGDPIRMQEIAVVQLNPAGTSIDGTSTTGATTILRNVVLTSPISPTPVCQAGSIHDLGAGGLLVIENINIDAQTAGIVLDGAIGAARIVGSSVSNMPPGAIAYTLAATATITVGIAWQSTIYLTTDAAQRIVRIDPAATVPNTPVTLPTNLVGVRLSNNAIAAAGAIGAVMDETGIAEDDIRVAAFGSLYGRVSRFLGSANFVASASALGQPITKTYGAPDTFEPIRRSNGGVGIGDSITLEANSERFDLQTPGADPPGEWYLRYQGPLPLTAVSVGFGVSLQAASTSSTVQLRIERRSGTLGAWTPVSETTRTIGQINNVSKHVSAVGFVTLQPDDHFRLTIANDNAAATTQIVDLAVNVSGTI